MSITPDKVFAHLDRIQAWRSGEKPAPVTLEWDLSNRCDRGCQACHMAYTHVRGPLKGAHDGPPGSTSTGDLADTEMVLRALSEVAAAGVQGVVWTGGGEPTLHPGFDPIVSTAARLGLAQGMYTHGGHIDRKRAELIRQYFSWVVISLDRADAESYRAYKGGGPKGFDKVCQGVRMLASVEGRCTVGVSFLLDADTWQDAERFAAFRLGLGADYVTFRPMIDFDQADPAQAISDRSWVTEAMPTLQKLATQPGIVCDPPRFAEYRDWQGRNYATCYGVRMNATITPDGRVWLCVNKRGFPGAELGDLKKESFSSLWARHPGKVTDFSLCRVMCRLHLVNERLAAIEAPMTHTEFV